MVGTNWPHVPWPKVKNANQAPAPPLPPTHIDTPETRKWRARYAAAVERYDTDLGRVYDSAEKTLGNNTMFIQFSDHGAQWPFGKWNLYDAGTRVTFVAAWPGVIRPGRQSDAMISLVDVLPTLIAAGGGTPPNDLDGQSFLDVLTETTSSHRDQIFTTHSGDGNMNAYPMRSVRTRDWKYIRNLNPDARHTTHIDRGKAVDGNGYWQSWVERSKTDAAASAVVERYHVRPAEELYDLRTDPHEQHNLAGESHRAATLRQLSDELDNWMRGQNDAGPATENALRNSNGLVPSP
jgi:uncharacterized sulfatase